MTEVSIEFPDRSIRNFQKGITVIQVAESISNSLKKAAIACSLDGVLSDLSKEINKDCKLEIFTIKNEKIALELIRHDCAHIMARAVQEIWPDTKVTIGPVIENGWFYDFDRDEPFTPENLLTIEKKMREIINLKDPVKFEIWERTEAIKYYKEKKEPYKVQLINDIPEKEEILMYWHGYWQDLCRGPHLANTGQIPGDCFKLMSIAGAYWKGDSNNKMLQRIYGVAFRNRDELKKYLNFLEEAQKRDHRKIGKEMELFHMQEEAPGMVFWHPNGWRIYQILQNYMQQELEKGGYSEVKTPQVVGRKLWEDSGHWDKFQEHMFIVEVDEEGSKEKRINALKPMNCPCHIQIYNQGVKSYRDLPFRMSEFGSCHRYEPSGAMHGIMRVRGFTQDDAHIFCTEEQIESETKKFIELLSKIYADLGFADYKIKFSDRPEKRAGSDETWFKAEEALKNATDAAGFSFEFNPGEGAFYGPKLEFVLTDAIGRDWQCGTLQVDFVLPERLNANYIAMDGNKKNVVMLHRAILGSFERFIGILIEENSGKLPLWLTPTQVVIASVVSGANNYAKKIYEDLISKNIRAKLDIRNEKINYKIREHSLKKIPIIFAVGLREVENKTVTVRKLGSNKTTTVDLLEEINEIIPNCKIPD
tara:strand:+ start:1010 stop:2950 length:1941 start_codon:yes stop_codon:yes gene_type:complete